MSALKTKVGEMLDDLGIDYESDVTVTVGEHAAMSKPTVEISDENGVIWAGDEIPTPEDISRASAHRQPLMNNELPRMVSRFEEMLRDQQTIAESLKDLADEAKEKGFDVAAIRKAASLRIDAKARLKYEKSTKTLLDLMEAIDDPLVVR